MSRWEAMLRCRPFACSLPGAELERFPFLSGYGLALRVTRLTALTPEDLKSVLGVRGGSSADVFLSTRRPWPKLFDLLEKLGLAGSGIADYWTEEAWSPVQLHGAWNSPPGPVRLCPICARYGYHSMLFQLPSIEQCPWHSSPFETHCPDCLAPNGGGFGPGQLLSVCNCGHDPFQPDLAATRMWEFPTAQTSAWIDAYLDWAEAERPFRHLVARPGSGPSDWAAGFAALAAPPPALMPDCTPAKLFVRTFDAPSQADPEQRHFWGWSQLSGDRQPVTYLALPENVRPALEAATKRAISRLPQTPLGLRPSMHAFGLGQRLANSVEYQTDRFIVPFGDGSDGLTWLNLSAVDPCALLVCDRLVQSVAETLGGLQISADRSWQAARSQAIDRVWGRAALGGALRELLARGYEQGVEAVVRLHIGCTWPAERPWLEPLAEYRGRGRTLEQISIVWAPSRLRPVWKAATTPPSMPRARQPTKEVRRRKRKLSPKRTTESRSGRPGGAITR